MKWNKVTGYSWVAAIVVFLGAYALGFYVGARWEAAHAFTVSESTTISRHIAR